MSARDQGAHDALSTYGLDKIAWSWDGVAEGAKRIAIGEPGRVWNELNAGTLHKPGGALREAFVPPGFLGKALNWGLPAIGVASALSAPAESRGTAVGQAAGASLGGILGSPLGGVGAIAGSALGGALGRTLGGAFDTKPQRERPYHFDSSSFVR
jgi:hypothetical protein